MGRADRREPDVICDKSVLIEIVDIYENENQARKLLSNYVEPKDRKKKGIPAPTTVETLRREIEKKIEKLNNGNYDGLGIHNKFILLCGLMDPYIKGSSIDSILREYEKVSHSKKYQRSFNEIWIIWESEDKTKYNIFRLE